MTDLALDALAVFRISRLLTDDAILDAPRSRYVDRMTERGHENLAYLATCGWCVSAHVAFGVVVARRLFPLAWSPVARALAFSAVAGILSER